MFGKTWLNDLQALHIASLRTCSRIAVNIAQLEVTLGHEVRAKGDFKRVHPIDKALSFTHEHFAILSPRRISLTRNHASVSTSTASFFDLLRLICKAPNPRAARTKMAELGSGIAVML